MSDVYAEIIDRLFAKYRHSPNILKVFEILSDPLQDTSDAIDYIIDHLSIDDAEGPMLDAIGSWIGVQRQALQEEDIFWLFRKEDVGDDPENHHGLCQRSTLTTDGGYLTTKTGCPSKAYSGAYVDDETFRLYIRAKAATFRKKATRDIMYNYILQFGCRSKLYEGTRTVEIEPSSYDDINYAIQYHLTNLGYRPSGVNISIKRQTKSDAEV